MIWLREGLRLLAASRLRSLALLAVSLLLSYAQVVKHQRLVTPVVIDSLELERPSSWDPVDPPKDYQGLAFHGTNLDIESSMAVVDTITIERHGPATPDELAARVHRELCTADVECPHAE